MPLQVSLVSSPSDMDQIAPLDYEAWRVPGNPQLKHFRPNLATREEDIEYKRARDVQKFLRAEPNVFMVKATDDETGQIIGYANWVVNDPEKQEGDGKTHAMWHPEESEEREFAEIFINGLWRFMEERVTRKHMDLHSLIVDPKHRFRGAGRLLVRWGIDKADELGIEVVVSSLKYARPAYERSGLGYIEPIPPDPELSSEKEGRGEKWKELLQNDLTGCLMWRPIGRDWREGDKAPWMVEENSTK